MCKVIWFRPQLADRCSDWAMQHRMAFDFLGSLGPGGLFKICIVAAWSELCDPFCCSTLI
jgi:hypothetical protein